MKKILSIFVCLVFCFSLFGCGQSQNVDEAVEKEFSIDDFAAYKDGKKVQSIIDSEIGFISFANDYAGEDITTLRGVGLANGAKYQVETLYSEQRVGAGNIDNREDRYFVTFVSEDGQEYVLRFFFAGTDDGAGIKEIDIMKAP